jgi:hypothetical protein
LRATSRIVTLMSGHALKCSMTSHVVISAGFGTCFGADSAAT